MNGETLETPTITYDINLGRYVAYIDIDEEVVQRRLIEEGLSESEITETRIHVSADFAEADRRILETNGQAIAAAQAIYSPETKTATLHPLPGMQISNLLQQRENINGEPAMHPDYPNLPLRMLADSSYLSDKQSRNLYHELRHRKQDVVGVRDDTEAYESAARSKRSRHAAITLGSFLLTVVSLPLAYKYGVGPNLLGHDPEIDETLMVTIGSIFISNIIANKINGKGLKLNHELYLQDPNEVSAREAEGEVPEEPVVSLILRAAFLTTPISKSELHPALRKIKV